MKQQLRPSPEETPLSTLPDKALAMPAPRLSILAFLALVTLLLMLFSGLFLRALPTLIKEVQQASLPLFQAPGGASLPSARLPANKYVLYEQQNGLYLVQTSSGKVREVDAPGYRYNPAVPPVLTSSTSVLYSGDGLWLVDLFQGQARQIATLPSDQVITSLVVSRDGKSLAWSSASQDGRGTRTLYAGPLESTTIVRTQTADSCPCLRAFAFVSQSDSSESEGLLLTDDHGDHGDHGSVQHGLWVLPLHDGAQPRQLLSSDPPQGPLALSPRNNLLLYSSREGYIPAPINGNIPASVATVSYASNLLLSALDPKVSAPLTSYSVVSAHQTMDNPWFSTPVFTPDEQSIIYIQFSSEDQWSFARSYALYKVSLSGEGKGVRSSAPQLLSTSSAAYVELGSPLDSSTITVYADNALYAFNVQKHMLTEIAQTASYAHILAVVERNAA